jgi:hypothetical protein
MEKKTKTEKNDHNDDFTGDFDISNFNDRKMKEFTLLIERVDRTLIVEG